MTPSHSQQAPLCVAAFILIMSPLELAAIWSELWEIGPRAAQLGRFTPFS